MENSISWPVNLQIKSNSVWSLAQQWLKDKYLGGTNAVIPESKIRLEDLSHTHYIQYWLKCSSFLQSKILL